MSQRYTTRSRTLKAPYCCAVLLLLVAPDACGQSGIPSVRTQSRTAIQDSHQVADARPY